MTDIISKTCNKSGIAKKCPERIAQALKDAGYGNIERAVMNYVDILKTEICKSAWSIAMKAAICNHINNVFKKLYEDGGGEDAI